MLFNPILCINLFFDSVFKSIFSEIFVKGDTVINFLTTTTIFMAVIETSFKICNLMSSQLDFKLKQFLMNLF